MTGKVTAIVPIKSPSSAKSRLRAALGQKGTGALAWALAGHTLAVIESCGAIEELIVLTDDDEIERWVRMRGHVCLRDEPALSLSANLELVVESLRPPSPHKRSAANHHRLLIIPADLPLLNRAAVEYLIGQHEKGVLLCATQRDGGTSAMIFEAATRFPLQYGLLASASAHQQVCERMGVPVSVICLPEFASDLDVPGDMHHPLRHQWSQGVAETLKTHARDQQRGKDTPCLS